MASVEPVPDVDAPDLETLLRTVFGMSEAALDICLCVMAGGELTVADLADEVGYDRSVVARHLNHLATLGVVEKERRVLTQGGHAYVYRPVDPDVVRTRLTAAFFGWVAEATTELAAVRREKVEAIADAGESPQWRVFLER